MRGPTFHGTTVLAVRRTAGPGTGEAADGGAQGRVAIAADGQVTLERTIVKQGAHKVRRLSNGRVLAGFAGGAADAFALLTRFEEKLDEFSGRLDRAAVELVREWRTDRALRRLEAMLVVADAERTLLLSGTGDLIEPDDELIAVGSGGTAALAAARALARHTSFDARTIAVEALKIAGEIDIYTNDRIVVETL